MMPIKTPVKKGMLTDAQRHERFVEMAKEAGASADPEDFDKSFAKVTSPSSELSATSPRG